MDGIKHLRKAVVPRVTKANRHEREHCEGHIPASHFVQDRNNVVIVTGHIIARGKARQSHAMSFTAILTNSHKSDQDIPIADSTSRAMNGILRQSTQDSDAAKAKSINTYRHIKVRSLNRFDVTVRGSKGILIVLA